MTKTDKNIGNCFVCQEENISYRAMKNHLAKRFREFFRCRFFSLTRKFAREGFKFVCGNPGF